VIEGLTRQMCIHIDEPLSSVFRIA
jgi:hypothetical protein